MDGVYASQLLHAIDQRLAESSGRSMLSGREHADVLLELRLLASDLIALEALDAAREGTEEAAVGSRGKHWPHRRIQASQSRA